MSGDVESMYGEAGSGGIGARLSAWNDGYRRRFQIFADRVTPYPWRRWAGFVALLLVFFLRIYLAEGFYIVCYALFIYLLNVFIHFLTPKMDPDSGDRPILPQGTDDEYRPFERKLPEFKFWWKCVTAVVVAFAVSFFRGFDVPVYWPILVVYFFVLLVLTMKKEVAKWIKLGYVPWNRSKPSYA
jgi:hypothetical protein